MARKAAVNKRLDRSEIMQKARDTIASNPKLVAERKAKRSANRIAGRQEVSRDKSYPLDLFLRITGLSRMAYRKALETGLKARQVGDTTWITGEAWFEWLMKQ